MAKNQISDYETDPDLNTDIDNIGIEGTHPISNFDNALRALMAHLAKVNSGDAPLDDTFALTDADDRSKKVWFDLSAVSNSAEQTISIPNASGTLLLSGSGGVDADTLGGENASYFLDATNLTGQIDQANLPDLIDSSHLPTTINSDISGNAATASDAALLDGQEASYYLDATNLTGTIENARFPAIITSDISGNAATATDALALDGQNGSYYQDADNLTSGTLSVDRLPAITSDLLPAIPIELIPQAVLFPIGFEAPWQNVTPPSGWFIQDGSQFDELLYPLLFAHLGSNILPDMRGVVPRGLDNDRGLDEDQTRELGSYQADELASHVHNFLGATYNHEHGNSGNSQGNPNNSPNRTTESAGGAETRMKNIAKHWIIKHD